MKTMQGHNKPPGSWKPSRVMPSHKDLKNKAGSCPATRILKTRQGHAKPPGSWKAMYWQAIRINKSMPISVNCACIANYGPNPEDNYSMTVQKVNNLDEYHADSSPGDILPLCCKIWPTNHQERSLTFHIHGYFISWWICMILLFCMQKANNIINDTSINE